jgi:chorismate mutase/prephenate dehydratase
MSLDELRKRIDEIDGRIVRLINERAKLVHQIGQLKAETNESVYKPQREQAVYDNAVRVNEGPLSGEAVKGIFREIMSGCMALEKPLKIAYLGPPGTFTHWAARSKFGDSVTHEPVNTLDEVFQEVERRRADYGVVPVENSTEGGIRETLARFLDSPLKVCAEIVYEIHLSLLANCPLEEIRKVYSKGTVFGQTRRWIRSRLPGAELVEVGSTSRAAELAAAEAGAAAIGHAELAVTYGLDVLFDHIEDCVHNVTRFFVLGDHISDPTGDDKTAILCSVKDKVGALHDLLVTFKVYGINMTRIESFPSPTTAWRYYFFIDFLGHPADEKVRLALEEMRKECEEFRILGAFPRCRD